MTRTQRNTSVPEALNQVTKKTFICGLKVCSLSLFESRPRGGLEVRGSILVRGQMGDYGSSLDGKGESKREALLKGEESKSDTLLQQSIRINEESEVMGEQTLNALGGQRTQLERSRDQVHATGELTSDARTTMKTIEDKLFREKLVLLFIILLLLCADGLLVYRLSTNDGKIFGSSSGSSSWDR